jgi:hypothetical protein
MKDMKMERIQIWGVSVCVCYMLDDVSIEPISGSNLPNQTHESFSE